MTKEQILSDLLGRSEAYLAASPNVMMITPEQCYKAMQEYAMLCLEKAAESARVSQMQGPVKATTHKTTTVLGFTYSVDKESIVNPNNLV